MIGNRKRCPNPVLETKRDGYLAAEKEKRDDLLDVYRLSIEKTKHLHANLLFTTIHGKYILAAICQHVTFINPSVMTNSWRDLAVRLGYSDIEAKCINNFRGDDVYDPTEILLKFYAATKTEGTVGHIMQVLLELGFLPALHQAQKHIESFLTELESGEADIIKAPSIIEDCQTKNIIKAANFKPRVPVIFDSSLSKDVTMKIASFDNRNNDPVQHELLHRARPQPQQHKQYCKCVMLSFASDGYATASRAAAVLRATTNKKGFPVGVVMLCENDDIVMMNPGQMITDIISQVDFVIPVLTDGYFAALKCPNRKALLVDERYIQFIHSILVSKYIDSDCISNVRPIIPTSSVSSIHSRLEFMKSLIFKSWKTDDDLQALARNVVKSHRSRVLTQ